MPAHTYSLQYLLPGELNHDQPQNIQYGNVDDTPLGKYLTKTTLLLLLPLASMYCVCIVTSCEHYVWHMKRLLLLHVWEKRGIHEIAALSDNYLLLLAAEVVGENPSYICKIGSAFCPLSAYLVLTVYSHCAKIEANLSENSDTISPTVLVQGVLLGYVYIAFIKILIVSNPPDKHSLKTVLNSISTIAADWFILGTALGVSPGTLKTIEYNYRTAQRCQTEMITAWLQNSSRRSWRHLASALSSPLVNRSEIATMIAAEHPK